MSGRGNGRDDGRGEGGSGGPDDAAARWDEEQETSHATQQVPWPPTRPTPPPVRSGEPPTERNRAVQPPARAGAEQPPEDDQPGQHRTEQVPWPPPAPTPPPAREHREPAPDETGRLYLSEYPPRPPSAGQTRQGPDPDPADD